MSAPEDGPAVERSQNALVTGGSSGIGWAVVRQYVERGGRVVIGDLAEPSDIDLMRYGESVLFVQTDVTSPPACAALVQMAIDHCGAVPDVCVAAAGIAFAEPLRRSIAEAAVSDSTRRFDSPAGSVINLENRVLDKLLDVNLRGTFNVIQAYSRAALAGGAQAAIVTVSSAAGSIPLRGGAAYCVSKAGVEMLTKVLALELGGAGIRVNAIAPGYIDTPMTAGVPGLDKSVHGLLSTTPLGRLGRADEIADGIFFLGSPRSSYMTGQVMHMSGGQFVG